MLKRSSKLEFGLVGVLLGVLGSVAFVQAAGHYSAAAMKSDWRAKWIWATSAGKEQNIHVYFRRTFTLKQQPGESVEVLVSAATHYTLYVNGKKAGFGPPISDQRYHYYDVRDIGPYLQQGKNVVAAHVYSLASPTEDFHGGRGMFLLEAAIEDSNGPVVLDTDKRWKCLISPVWKRNTPRQSFQLHYVEIADLRKEPLGWSGSEFDDSSWRHALEVGLPPQGGYVHLVKRDLGDFDEEFVAVAKVVAVGEVRRQVNENPAEQVQSEQLQDCSTVTLNGVNGLAGGRGAARVQTAAPGRDAVIVLDMGRQVIGCPFFEADGAAAAVIDVSISEILKDGRVLAKRQITPGQWTYLADRVTLRAGVQSWQRYDYNGYRYIQLTIRNAAEPVTIRRVGTVLRNYRFANEANFRCSDEMLNRIFDVSKWSHKVNTHWGYCGSSWREHAQWSDLVWPALNFAVFCDAAQMRYYLHQVTLSQNAEGMMAFPYPGRISIELPEQTMWLAEDLWNHWLYFGDYQTIKDLFGNMVRANDWFRQQLTPRGLISTTGWKGPRIWLVIDWGYPFVNNTSPGELATLNLIYYQFLRCTERLARQVGDWEQYKRFQSQAEKLAETINDVFFVRAENRYYEKPGRVKPSHFASTLAVLYEVVPPQYADEVFEFAVGEQLRAGKCCPWFMFTVLEAFGRAGRYADGVRAIDRYWGKYIEQGATTFWELWPIPGEDIHPIEGYKKVMGSLTITYSSGPAAYVVRHVLGVRPLEGGFAKTLIAPHYSGLSWGRGRAPTPAGYVEVAWRAGEGKEQTHLDIKAPAGIEAQIEVPYSPRQRYLKLNGRLVYDGKMGRSTAGVEFVQRKEQAVVFRATGGEYEFVSGVSGESK